MVERVIKWDIDAWNDYVSWQAEDKKTIHRFIKSTGQSFFIVVKSVRAFEKEALMTYAKA